MQLLPLTTPAWDAAAGVLCQHLNARRAVYPATALRLEYEILSASRAAVPQAGAAIDGPPRAHSGGRGPPQTTRGPTATLCLETPVGRNATAHGDPDTLSSTKAPENGKSEGCWRA